MCPTHCGAKKTPKVGTWIRERLSSAMKNRLVVQRPAWLREGVGGGVLGL